MELESYNVVTVVATVASSVFVAVTTILIRRQLVAMRASQDLSALLEVRNILQDEHLRRDRAYVLSIEHELEHWSAEDRAAAERVCHAYSFVGYLIERKLIEADMARPWAAGIARCHRKCRPLIKRLRVVRDPMLWTSFDSLAELAHSQLRDQGLDLDADDPEAILRHHEIKQSDW